ncbi:unnamed protein product [Nezara viridula]|uniref:D-isomer specific 2-hydroxyacid dehydrogenase NAD-binding domain-containing protein n=1 Tax=Nezara viridula TaxID=85310 RepID=A0A9P0H7H1_NEZVI|nr:unnamed protein product [Nezara viridula]
MTEISGRDVPRQFFHADGNKEVVKEEELQSLKMSNRPKVFISRSDYPEAGIKLLRDRCEIEVYNSLEKDVPTNELLNKLVGKDALFITSKNKINKEVVEAAGDQLGAEFIDFDSLLQQSDFVIVTCPLTSETEGIFTAEKFSLMKRSAIFINSARGAIVDQESLVHALKNKIIAAAGLDVMTPEPLPKDHPLVSLDNCVLTPHIGSATLETRDEMCILTAKNILAALDGEKMPAEYIL